MVAAGIGSRKTFSAALKGIDSAALSPSKWSRRQRAWKRRFGLGANVPWRPSSRSSSSIPGCGRCKRWKVPARSSSSRPTASRSNGSTSISCRASASCCATRAPAMRPSSPWRSARAARPCGRQWRPRLRAGARIGYAARAPGGGPGRRCAPQCRFHLRHFRRGQEQSAREGRLAASGRESRPCL